MSQDDPLGRSLAARIKKALAAGTHAQAVRSAQIASPARPEPNAPVSMEAFRLRAHELVNTVGEKDGRGLALAYFNLANFRSFNERYGMDAGDELLALTGDAIREAFPQGLISRFAEDRYVLLAPCKGIEEGVARARRIVRAHRREVAVELKAGVYVFDGSVANVDEAYGNAKAACDSIKLVHDVHCRLYDAELASLDRRRQFVIDNFEAALDAGRIKVYYQPIYRASTGRLCASEALVRWIDPVRGAISPAEFADVLEETRLIHALDAFVVRSVCEQWGQRRRDGVVGLPVSVNLSRVDFQVMDVVALAEDATREAAMPRQMLRFEVTEGAVVQNDGALDEQVARLRALGYQVWMDDFGTGVSSLADLKTHEFEVIKIDMGFLQDLDQVHTRTILVSVVEMIRRLGMQTLAEGVETDEQRRFLREAGCELLQGYGLAHPLCAADFTNLLLAEEDDLEPFSMHGYYDAIGRVDLLPDSTVLVFGNGDATGLRTSNALGICEYDILTNEATMLIANRDFKATLRSVGLDPDALSRGRLDEYLAEPTTVLGRFAREVCHNGRHGGVDLVIGGDHCVIRGSMVASVGNRHAILVSLESVPGGPGAGGSLAGRIAMEQLPTLFDRVDLIDVETGKVDNLSLTKSHSMRAFGEGRTGTVDDKYDFLPDVYPDDRARFLDFCDARAVQRRLVDSGLDYLTEAFRVMSSEGGYVWQEVMVLPVALDGRAFVLSCVRELRPGVVSRILEPSAEISSEVLWNTTLRLTDRKIFWKDADRRFVGASQGFLDYFGFDSIEMILGKTDEDMGWHVDPHPFMQGEKNVLRGGAIEAVRGTCIAHGQVRRIVASKRALVRDGRVVGLRGYFEDAEEASGVPFDFLDDPDEAPSVIEASSLIHALGSFEREYRADDTDYALHFIGLDNLRTYNRVQGHAFGDHVLHEVARELDRDCGCDSVVSRWRADEFVIVHQLRNASDTVESMLARIDAAIARVDECDGIPIRVEASTDSVRRGELPGFDTLTSLIEERIHEERVVLDDASVRDGSHEGWLFG